MARICLLVALAVPMWQFPALAQAAEPATAEAIMARVALNQDRAEAERSHYIYVQHARVASRKGGRILCEETTDTRVTPSAAGSDQQLLKLDGRFLHKGHYVSYSVLRPRKPVAEDDDDVSIEMGDGDDRGLVESLRAGLMNNKSRDGISARLFPLTSKQQAQYRFELIGRERIRGRDVFHIEFRPQNKADFGWKGDAYIDAAAYQPVAVSTVMSRNIPFAVRTLLGTNLPGLGFTVTYAPAADGVWFPVSFGTEFKIHLLFFYSRDVTINLENRDFERTQVTSDIVGAVDIGAEPKQ